MAYNWDPFVKIEGIPSTNGPTSINAILIDNISTVPYEGIWVPWMYTKQGSLDVFGTFATLSLQLYGTNQTSPMNSWTVTMGGTATNNDVVTLNIATQTGTIAVPITITTAETTTQMAAALAAAVNTNSSCAAQGITASSNAAVMTLSWPSPAPAQTMFPYTTSMPAVTPLISLSSSVSGAATETVGIAAGTGGNTIGAAITAASLTQFTASARWLKIRVTTLTGGNLTAIAQGSA